jgi:hypothetical protein
MKDNLWFYKLLDLPDLPENLICQFDRLIENKLLGLPDQVYTPSNPRTDGYINVIQYKDHSLEHEGKIMYHNLPEEFEYWIQQNIMDNYLRVKFSIHHGTIAPPHTDYLRDYGIHYIYNPGGDDVRTVWYQEQGQSIVRNGRVRQPDYSKLTVLEEVVLPAKKWHVLRTDIVHSVENLQGNRIRIAVDLTAEQMRKINV